MSFFGLMGFLRDKEKNYCLLRRLLLRPIKSLFVASVLGKCINLKTINGSIAHPLVVSEKLDAFLVIDF